MGNILLNEAHRRLTLGHFGVWKLLILRCVVLIAADANTIWRRLGGDVSEDMTRKCAFALA
jgi:hypothetical protein